MLQQWKGWDTWSIHCEWPEWICERGIARRRRWMSRPRILDSKTAPPWPPLRPPYGRPDRMSSLLKGIACCARDDCIPKPNLCFPTAATGWTTKQDCSSLKSRSDTIVASENCLHVSGESVVETPSNRPPKLVEISRQTSWTFMVSEEWNYAASKDFLLVLV